MHGKIIRWHIITDVQRMNERKKERHIAGYIGQTDKFVARKIRSR